MLELWGFDAFTPGDEGWTFDGGGSPGRSNTTFRSGTHAMAGDGVDTISPGLGNLSMMYAGAAIRWNYLMVKRVLAFFDGTTAQITVVVESDGSLTVRRGGQGGTVLETTAAGLMTANAWHHIQLYVLFHGTTGAFELKFNGNTVASGSNVNTVNSGNAYASRLRLTAPDGISQGYFDDVWISDTAFQGDCVVETKYASADGSSNNFTASGAANRYQCVDETPHNSDTDYVYSDNVNDIQLFEMQNLTATTGTIKGVKCSHVTRKDDAGARSVAMVVRSGSNSVRSTQSLSTSYQIYSETLTQDPVDSAAWTIAKVNALELGLKIIS